MHPSGRARLRTYFFRTAKYRLKGNILWRKIGPWIPISLTRWTRICVIILKNDGGNIISRLTKLWTTSSCSLLRLDGSIAFWEIVLRKAHSFMIIARTLAGRIPLSATRINYVIKTWQSWDFTCANFFSFRFSSLFIFEEYPWWDLDTVQTVEDTLLLFLTKSVARRT